ncbi:MAG TPA: hypothetical protein VIV54_20595 [Burkholderiales bacterium]
MDLLIEALVFVVQLALAGFLVWGGWLCLQYRLRGGRVNPAGASAEDAKTGDFERAVSLVLLALLFTSVTGETLQDSRTSADRGGYSTR